MAGVSVLCQIYSDLAVCCNRLKSEIVMEVCFLNRRHKYLESAIPTISQSSEREALRLDRISLIVLILMVLMYSIRVYPVLALKTRHKYPQLISSSDAIWDTVTFTARFVLMNSIALRQ